MMIDDTPIPTGPGFAYCAGQKYVREAGGGTPTAGYVIIQAGIVWPILWPRAGEELQMEFSDSHYWSVLIHGVYHNQSRDQRRLLLVMWGNADFWIAKAVYHSMK